MHFTRRNMLKLYGLSGLGLAVAPSLFSFSLAEKIWQRAIPSSGEQLPVIGLDTWQNFGLGNASEALTLRELVLLEIQKLGGKVIDSSPMHGSL